jgi:hypothetical protein
MFGPALAILAMILAALTRRRKRRYPAHAVIVSPRRSTVVNDDGAVRSVQTAEITLSAEDLERMWIVANLQNLAKTYWRFLTRVTLGLVRVAYGHEERCVVLIARPLTLLRFASPDYSGDGEHGHVHWAIRDGLLVAKAGRGTGRLALDVQRLGPENPIKDTGREKLRIQVEVANFYPAIAAGFSMPVYKLTQSYLHVLVTHAFLRSLASLDLAESQAGPFVFSSPAQPAPVSTESR